MSDPVYDFLNSGGKVSQNQPTPKSGDAVYDFLNSGGNTIPAGKEPEQSGQVEVRKSLEFSPLEAPDAKAPMEIAGNMVTGLGAQIIGGWRGLSTLATGGSLEDAANAVHEEQQRRTYQPESKDAQAALGAVGKVVEGARNLSGSLAEGAAEVGANLPGPIGEAARIAKNIPGLPRTAGELAFDVGTQVIPFTKALKGARPVEQVPAPHIEPTLSQEFPTAQSLADARTSAMQVWRDINAQREKVSADPNSTAAQLRELRAQADAAKARYESLGDAKVSPSAETLKTEPTLAPVEGRLRDRFQTSAEAGEEIPKFLEEPPEAATPVDQLQRAKTLRRVGVEAVRKSAVEGDAQSAATDYQTAKLDSPAGRHMRSVLESEKAALENYSENLIRETGGTIGTDTSTLYGRGNTILAPLDSLNNYFNKQISALYKKADERAGGQPVNLPKTQEFVGGDQADFLGTTEGEALLKGVKARMKSLGMVDAEGNPLPVTVKQAEQLKQYLNNQWQPRTSRLISGMKNAIDDDVLQTAGEDIYRQARAMRAMKSDVFENDLTDPQGRTIRNGISKLFDANGKGLELKSGASTEKVADIVTSLPADQLGQIVKTLKTLPKELAPEGEAALAEIKSQFANKIHEVGSAQQGQWAAKNVSKYLNKNAARLQQVFTPEELDRFNDLNNAGHILAKDQSYPGAAVQEHNLVQKGVMHGVRSGSAAVGGALGGAPGAAVGGLVGNIAAGKVGEAASLKAAQKRTLRLSDFPGIDK